MIGRRDVLKVLAAAAAFILSGFVIKKEKKVVESRGKISEVYVIKTRDRREGIGKLLEHFDISSISGKMVGLKANYNSADPFPASTHIDTLSTLVESLQQAESEIILAERSGMGDTRQVMEETGVTALAGEKGFEMVVLDNVGSDVWDLVQPEGSHWKRGFLFPKVFQDVDAVVQTCCLKTHQFGGHFTMSLKNSVGMVAKYDPDDGYNYMNELHLSLNQRDMIAEINTAYEPDFIIMDALQGFSHGGPHEGTFIEPGLMLASRDRIALDAVGVAILRLYGTTSAVSKGTIFQQEQIARAAQLGLGAAGPEEVEVVPLNDAAEEICENIRTEFRTP